jgi:two-component system response regulator
VSRQLILLCADDDPDDRLLLRDAARQCAAVSSLHFATDGEDALAFLRHQGRHADPKSAPRPDLILVDLNMPRMDGRELVRALKSDANLRSIPVVVLTTSRAEADVAQAYDLGANSYITKPVTFDGLITILLQLSRYWSETVRLPQETVA